MIEFEDTRWNEQSLMPPSSLVFMSISHDEDEERVLLPAPSQPHQRDSSFSQRQKHSTTKNTTTLLVPENKELYRKRKLSLAAPSKSQSSVLFGAKHLHWEHENTPKALTNYSKGMANYFLGFMMEEDSAVEEITDAPSEPYISQWNKLNIALFLGLILTTAATTVPVTLIPTIARSLTLDTVVSTRATESAIFGAALGKFFNGPLGDLLGARRLSLANAIVSAIALFILAISWNEASVLWACFFIEFSQSVQWPCVIVILAQHYGTKDKQQLDGSIYVTSMAPRFGRLISIPLVSLLLRTLSWRIVVIVGNVMALAGASVIYIFVRDSPSQWHEPQNPISTSHYQQLEHQLHTSLPLWKNAVGILTFCQHIFWANLFPVLRTVLTQKTFWIVAFAHSGDTMVQTSQRVLGSYFQDTSFGTLSENRAGGLSVALSFGLVAGLAVAGGIFTRARPRKRKRLILRLYVLTITSCYLLGLLAIPRLRALVGEPGFILGLQVIVTFFLGVGIAVQSNIPGLVGATYGKSKGLFCSYTDGVAYAVSSWVWKVVSNAVHNGNLEGGGWAYGWAAVALLEILCGIVMVEFMEQYFGTQTAPYKKPDSMTEVDDGYETILLL